jgi:molybdenum cofactor biosynthesis protein MoaF
MPRPTDWKYCEDSAAGIDTNRLPPTDVIVGQVFELTFPRAPQLTLDFITRDVVRWHAGKQAGTDWYEAVLVAPTTYFLDMTFKSSPRESLTLIVNTMTSHVLSVRSIAGQAPTPDAPLVEQVFDVGTLTRANPAAPAITPQPTRDLIGLRAFHRYSPNHLYEHMYLSSARYAWQCLLGQQRGHAAVDLATTYKFAPEEYVFTGREFQTPVASVFFLNFRELRSTGKFLGLTRKGTLENRPAGAFIQRASTTFYDTAAAPA